MTDPLVVNPEIELPQLDISKNYTADCTIEYSTGWLILINRIFAVFKLVNSKTTNNFKLNHLKFKFF